MMTPIHRLSLRGSEASCIRAGTATPTSFASPPARRRNWKRCASLSGSGNTSMLSLQKLNDDLLTLPVTMKTVAADEEKEQPLPRSAMVKNLRLISKKRRELIQMQKTLTDQQNTYLDLYAQIRDLEARNGVEHGETVGQVRVVTVAGWPAYDLLMLVRGDSLAGETDLNGVIGPAVLTELKSQMSTIPEEVLNMGADLMARRLEILEFLRIMHRVEHYSNNQEWKNKNIEFEKETESLHNLVVETVKDLEAKVMHCLNIARTPWIDRETLIKTIRRLQREVAIFQNKAPEVKDVPGDKPNHVQGPKSATDPPTDAIRPHESNTKLLEELKKERDTNESLKHIVSSAEGMLRTARARVAELERQLKDTRAQLDNSIRKHKEYEMLHRHRATSYDVRSKKLLEVSKHGEVTIEMLSRQRDALELRVKELQDQMKTIADGYEARQLEQKARIETLQAQVAEQEKQIKAAESRVQDLKKRYRDLQVQHEALRERSERLVKVESERCLDYLPRKEQKPSQSETEIWKELQVTKMKLERVSEELRQSRADKESLLNSLSRIAQEGPVENKMANELVNREQKIFNLQKIIDDLKGKIKSMNENISHKDSELRSYKVEVARLRDNQPSNNSSKQDLTLEVIDLSAQVAALTSERAQLLSAVASRALMLERHERCAELFAQVTRARRELAAQIVGRSEHRLTQAPHTDVNLTASLSSVCKSAAETWTQLRRERERVLKLQNVVKSQNVHLDRELRIRTQLEKRRAVLERVYLNCAIPDQVIKPVPKEYEVSYSGSPYYSGDEEFEV